MTTSRSCSWCHTMNVISPGPVAPRCSNCGHRADVPRTLCDCGQCRTLTAAVVPDVEIRLAELKTLVLSLQASEALARQGERRAQAQVVQLVRALRALYQSCPPVQAFIGVVDDLRPIRDAKVQAVEVLKLCEGIA